MLFKDIANTLKTLAEVLLVVFIILSLVACIAILVYNSELFLVAVILLIGGIVSALVGSSCLYGFGELIEKATEIADNTRPASANKNTNTPQASNPTSNLSAPPQPIPNNAKNQYDNARYTDSSYKILVGAINQNISACIIHPNTKVINPQAFEHCSKLKSVTIPEGVTTIGNNAFYACEELTSITIPNSITSIGFGAFQWCKNLTQITYVGTPQELQALGTSWREGIPPKYQITFKQQ